MTPAVSYMLAAAVLILGFAVISIVLTGIVIGVVVAVYYFSVLVNSWLGN